MKQVLPLIQAQFDRMCATGKLFQSQVSGNEIIDAYLDELIVRLKGTHNRVIRIQF